MIVFGRRTENQKYFNRKNMLVLPNMFARVRLKRKNVFLHFSSFLIYLLFEVPAAFQTFSSPLSPNHLALDESTYICPYVCPSPVFWFDGGPNFVSNLVVRDDRFGLCC